METSLESWLLACAFHLTRLYKTTFFSLFAVFFLARSLFGQNFHQPDIGVDCRVTFGRETLAAFYIIVLYQAVESSIIMSSSSSISTVLTSVWFLRTIIVCGDRWWSDRVLLLVLIFVGGRQLQRLWNTYWSFFVLCHDFLCLGADWCGVFLCLGADRCGVWGRGRSHNSSV